MSRMMKICAYRGGNQLEQPCLPASYRWCDFRDGDAVGDWVAVIRVVDQNARQEHGAQVVSVQDVQGESGGSRASVRRVRSSVLQDGNTNDFLFTASISWMIFCRGHWGCTSIQSKSIESIKTIQ